MEASFQIVTFLIETLVDELKPVVMEKHEVDNRYDSKIVAVFGICGPSGSN